MFEHLMLIIIVLVHDPNICVCIVSCVIICLHKYKLLK